MSARSLLMGVMLAAFVLRKVHLIRPDLIPYPIAVEVWC